jgi:peptide/nickel transport system permease protein
MGTYIITRLLWAIVIIVLVTIIVFLLMRLLPGDPLLLFLGENEIGYLTEEQLAEMRHQYGLDKPLIVQYFDWMRDTFHGDLGYSISNQENLSKLLVEKFPVSIELSFISWVVGNFVGLSLGILSALRRGKWVDSISMGLSYIGITIPGFWLAILLIYLVGMKLNLLPLSGWTSPSTDLAMHFKQLVMPVICLCVASIGGLARLMRSSLLEVIQQDYIRTAWSKGLRERVVVLKHALKNSFIPMVTVIGMGVTTIFSGSFIIETIFSIPGMGRLMVNALFAHDYAVVQFSVLFSATLMIIANVIVDISYGFFDPRIRYD